MPTPRPYPLAAALILCAGAARAEAGPRALSAPNASAADNNRPLSLAERWMRRPSGPALPGALPSRQRLLDEAIERFCADAADPAACRADIFDRLVRSPKCYIANTPEEFDRVIRETGLIPASLLGRSPEERFGSTTAVWGANGDVVFGGASRAQRANLTFSFPPNGTTWGAGADAAPNDLFTRLNAFFGVADRDRALELFRQVFANYQRNAGLTYTEVADDGAAFTFGTFRSPLRGDIRIGSVPLGSGGVLAYNFFPDGGGDMTMNSGSFGFFSNPSTNFRALRNTVAHEHGHGMGYFHVVPCNSSKIMEPFIQTSTEMLAVDDRRGMQRNYGDRFAGNNSPANATNFGDLTSPILTSVIERDLSTNGTAGFNNSDEDWFRFTLSSTQNIVVSAAPTGGSYPMAVNFNNGDCSGSPTTINASAAGNLNIQLIASDGTTVIQTAGSAAAGATETLTRNAVAAGTYFVRVFDVGPNNANDQFVQTYDLTLRVGAATAPPQAIAGVNKRVAQGFPCWFRADLNSRANEPGVGISTYQWDFENDGTFDAAGPEVSTTFPTPGVRTVRLRVTDTNGRTDDDTILVTVFDATPPPPPSSPTLLSPADGAVVTILNPTFDWEDSADVDFYRFTVDDDPNFGSPVFVTDVFQSTLFTTPGTFAQDVTYHWKVVAVSSFGSTPSTPASRSFLINTTPPPECLGDLDNNGVRDTVDLVIFLGRFGNTTTIFGEGDLNGDAAVNTADLVILLGRFGVPCG